MYFNIYDNFNNKNKYSCKRSNIVFKTFSKIKERKRKNFFTNKQFSMFLVKNIFMKNNLLVRQN